MKNKTSVRTILALTLALICAALFPTIAFATDINVNADSTSVKTGDTITVTVIVKGDHISVADGVFTYDPALLTYISSNGGASDGNINLVSVQKGGSDSLTTVIKFTAIGSGEAVVNVSMESVLDYDGNDIGAADAGVSISIASTETEDPGEDGDNAPKLDLSQTGVAAQNVLGTDEQMYIWRSLRNISLPSGFTDKQVTYNDEFVGGAAIPDNEDLMLLYLSEASGENASYYIYKEKENVFFPYLTVLSVSARFTVIWPDESVEVPQGFKEATIELNEQQMPVWAAPNSDGTVYLVYARNSKGEKDFYLYNTEDRSLQRYNAIAKVDSKPEQTPQPTPTSEPETEPAVAPIDNDKTNTGSISPALLIALIAACTLFAAAAVVFAILYKKAATQSKKESKKGISVKNADIGQ